METSAESPHAFPQEPLAYPTRLQIRGHPRAYQLYAYPTQRKPNTLVQLQTPIPAIVSYVLGPSWHNDLSDGQTIAVPQESWTKEDETALAFRMLRGGGAIMDVSYANNMWWLFGDGFDSAWTAAEQQKKYIFGWPKDGGVWVLHLPPLLEKHVRGELDMNEELALMEDWEKMKEVYREGANGSVHYGELARSEAMEDFCGRLKDASAMYYADILDSPEVVESGLVDEVTAMQKEAIRS